MADGTARAECPDGGRLVDEGIVEGALYVFGREWFGEIAGTEESVLVRMPADEGVLEELVGEVIVELEVEVVADFADDADAGGGDFFLHPSRGR